MKPSKRNLLAQGVTGSTTWSIYELEFGYQAVIKYAVLIGKYRTKRLATLTYADAMKWIEEQV
jgi:hypothetical protein